MDLKILLQFVKIATRCPCCFYDLSQHNQQASITLLFNTDGIIEKVARWSGVPWLCEPSRKAPLHFALRQLQILIQVQYPDSQRFNRKFVKKPHFSCKQLRVSPFVINLRIHMFPAACFGPLSNFHSVLWRYAEIVFSAGRADCQLTHWFRRVRVRQISPYGSRGIRMVQSCSIFRLHELTMLFLATAVLNLIIMSIVYARFISWMIARFAPHSW